MISSLCLLLNLETTSISTAFQHSYIQTAAFIWINHSTMPLFSIRINDAFELVCNFNYWFVCIMLAAIHIYVPYNLLHIAHLSLPELNMQHNQNEYKPNTQSVIEYAISIARMLCCIIYNETTINKICTTRTTIRLTEWSMDQPKHIPTRYIYEFQNI